MNVTNPSIIALLFFCYQSFAQVNKPLKSVPTKEWAAEIGIHTNGFQLGLLHNRQVSQNRYRSFQMSLLEIKHPREARQKNEFVSGNSNAKSFIFGKQNNFYVTRIGYGEKRFFSEKALKNGVSLGYTFSGGINVGVLKPYYLDFIRSRANGTQEFSAEPYSEENASDFLDRDRIYGGSGLAYGFDDITLKMGGFAKTGLYLDWGAEEAFLRAVEIGVCVDAFPKKIPIMINQDNQAVFLNLYLILQFGKKY